MPRGAQVGGRPGANITKLEAHVGGRSRLVESATQRRLREYLTVFRLSEIDVVHLVRLPSQAFDQHGEFARDLDVELLAGLVLRHRPGRRRASRPSVGRAEVELV